MISKFEYMETLTSMVIGQMAMHICHIISVALITTSEVFTRSTDVLGTAMEKSVSTCSNGSVL